MALSGFKNFLTGTILTEGDIDNYLMQNISVYADAAARDGASGLAILGGLEEGRFCFLKDSDTLQFYDGTTWVNIAKKSEVDAIDTDAILRRLYMETDGITG